MNLIAIEPVKCGGKRTEPGEPFEASDEVGKQLIASGAAKKGTAKASISAEAEAKAKAEAEAKARADANKP